MCMFMCVSGDEMAHSTVLAGIPPGGTEIAGRGQEVRYDDIVLPISYMYCFNLSRVKCICVFHCVIRKILKREREADT